MTHKACVSFLRIFLPQTLPQHGSLGGQQIALARMTGLVGVAHRDEALGDGGIKIKRQKIIPSFQPYSIHYFPD